MKNSEFEDFKNVEEVDPPGRVSEQILSRIRYDLNPSGLNVFKKLALIQFVTGIVTLMFCPQFGIGFLKNSMGLMGLLMKFGDNICMAGCGAVFLGLSALSAVVVLRPEELRVIKHNQMVQFPALALSTLGVFVCLGAPVLTTLGLAWLVGGVVGAISTLQLGSLVRSHLY
jgi:hypothetical protein